MLNDRGLRGLFSTVLPGETVPTSNDARSAIQPASLDLTVGEIYVPDVNAGEPGAIGSPQTAPYRLKPGHTAVVTTRETLHVPSTHAAIGFPPTTISNYGILMTNPGHVDPGYEGPLTFTVINMGREEFQLRPDDRIVTMLFFQLDGGAPDSDYAARHPGVAAPPVSQDRMTRLAPDMLDVDRRVKNIVEGAEAETRRAEAETRRLSIKVPLVLAIVVGAGTIFAPLVSNLVSQNTDLQRRISILEDRKNQDQLQNRVNQLEQQVSKLATPPTPGAQIGR